MSNINNLNKELMNTQDMIDWHPPPIRHIIWDGVLDVAGKLQLFGGEGSWKSGAALHMAYCVATGRRWMGFKTEKANVLVIAGEGGQATLRNRVVKYTTGSKSIYLAKPMGVPDEEARADAISFPPNVAFRYIDMMHLDEHSGIATLRRYIDSMIQAFPAAPVLLIVDPLYRIFGHDLSSQTDFNRFADLMELVLYDYNMPDKVTGYVKQLAVAVIHHPRKEGTDDKGNLVRHGSNEAFGSRELGWWFDAVLNTNLDPDDETHTTVYMKFTKYGRNTEGYLPAYIKVRWDKETLHPLILERPLARPPEEDIELRGTSLLEKLE